MAHGRMIQNKHASIQPKNKQKNKHNNKKKSNRATSPLGQ